MRRFRAADIAWVAVPAFLAVGLIGWIAGMPHPADVDPDAALIGEIGPAATPPPAVTPAPTSGTVPTRPDPAWVRSTAQRTGIPPRALEGYAGAVLRMSQTVPHCHLTWNTLAAIGEVESGHGTVGGAHIGPDGRVVGQILGPRLDGLQYAAVPDTDGGSLDGDPAFDRAVGPMQLLPATWKAFAADGNGDGAADPEQIDDAALTAGRLLCDHGDDMQSGDGWNAAVSAYNPATGYAVRIRQQANEYARAAG
jgi:membrane-bound lytic murein transglycosylase B